MKYLSKNKKGVSPIIATLLLIVIAVAAAVVTYAFVTGFIGTSTSTAKTQGQMSIDTAIVTSNTAITAYLRNTGTQSETLSAVYVNNTAVSSFSPGSLAPGTTLAVNITGLSTTWADGLSRTIRIVATDGTPASISVHS